MLGGWFGATVGSTEGLYDGSTDGSTEGSNVGSTDGFAVKRFVLTLVPKGFTVGGLDKCNKSKGDEWSCR